ncbi:phytanoyl-CoA dioxygenase family protein [Actinosynnema sp. NPDC050801]|uniref:phytanoyl-CoA dioxygenase family protein n=1 Tax=unclassified Actinosynnema TaxID=2637065 RepID=UPI0033DEB9F9
MLNGAQVERYRDEGFLLVEDVLGAGDVGRVRAEVERLYALDHDGRVMEKDGVTVRAIHGSHQVSELFARLARLPQLLSVAEQLLGSRVYLHQCKVNAKRALTGDVWQWHQDFVFWQQHDGLTAPLVVNAGVFLDEATEHNGALLVVPGSHRLGTLVGGNRGTGSGDEWKANFTADIDFALRADQLAPLVAERGIRSLTGPAGSLLFFDPMLVHGSGANMTPQDRSMALFSYNSVENVPQEVSRPRPEFLAARNRTPLEVLAGAL